MIITVIYVKISPATEISNTKECEALCATEHDKAVSE